MKNRFCRKGIAFMYAVCLLSAVGLNYSCSDDYDLDETMPSDLKGSIYDELKADGHFTTTVRLIDDLGYAEVLGKTGSKTLFVADDAAYTKFFENNRWGVKSYEELTRPQKKYLLYNAMLDNAYVLEMMANVMSTGTFGQANYNSGRNLCLRQLSAASTTDTIPFLRYNELPVSLNETETYGRYWNWHTVQANKPGMYLVCDNTTPMMTHFLETNMRYRDITNDDVAFILGIDPYGNENRSYIYDAQVVKQDVTCMNGYYNVLDRVLLAPSNMAEVIRTNGKTNIFSQILDRFSVPIYDNGLTVEARNLYSYINDSIYVKRYFSLRNQGSGTFKETPQGYASLQDSDPFLDYDPAWNQYQTSSALGAQQDMGAMFVPSDAAIAEYFLPGGSGEELIKRYGTRDNTRENLEYNIAQIPLNIIAALVKNLMKASFNETVPHKYLTIMNDARDQMFSMSNYPSVDAYKSLFEETLLANNGVVYIMNQVIAPADYASVSAPVLYSTSARVVNTVVHADDNFINGSSYANAPLQQYFSTYLKAMQASFSFFVPVDEGLAKYGYVDPASIAPGNTSNYRYWIWEYKANSANTSTGRAIPILGNAVKYNMETGQSGNPSSEGAAGPQSTAGESLYGSNSFGPAKRTLLVEMINQHIIVHENEDNDGVFNSPRHYFISRDGAPVYVKQQGNLSKNGEGMVVEGGWQLQLANDAYPENDHVCTVVEAYDKSRGNGEIARYGNGRTYFLDRPMQPSMQSVYGILKSNDDNFKGFRELCMGYDRVVLDSAGMRELAEAAALATGKNQFTDADWESAAALYLIFAEKTVAGSDYNGADQLVRFFNNYRYTVYAPSNKAVEDAIAKGLPTWASIKQFIEDNLEYVPGQEITLNDEGKDAINVTEENPGGEEPLKFLSAENKLKVQAMVTMLTNFVKYHFQNESLFVDNVTKTQTCQTQCIQNDVYATVQVKQTNGNMTVTDRDGNTRNVVTGNGNCNLLARDANFNASPSKGTSTKSGDFSSKCNFIKNSSYAVVHQIDGVLNFYPLNGGRYDAAWKTSSAAKKFVKKYQIKK